MDANTAFEIASRRIPTRAPSLDSPDRRAADLNDLLESARRIAETACMIDLSHQHHLRQLNNALGRRTEPVTAEGAAVDVITPAVSEVLDQLADLVREAAVGYLNETVSVVSARDRFLNLIDSLRPQIED